MNRISISATLAACFLAGGTLFAGGAKSWEHGSQADFEKGKLDNLTLRSDGKLSLAPVFRELYDPSNNYLWTVEIGRAHV